MMGTVNCRAARLALVVAACLAVFWAPGAYAGRNMRHTATRVTEAAGRLGSPEDVPDDPKLRPAQYVKCFDDGNTPNPNLYPSPVEPIVWSDWGSRSSNDSPGQSRCDATPLIDGENYLWSVADAMIGAKNEILISAWALSDFFPMFTRAGPDMLSILRDKTVNDGVEVFMLLWAGTPVTHQKANELIALFQKELPSGKIFITKHPGLIGLTRAHHQKFVVVDRDIAFLSGIDMCFQPGGQRMDIEDHLPVTVEYDQTCQECVFDDVYKNAMKALEAEAYAKAWREMPVVADNVSNNPLVRIPQELNQMPPPEEKVKKILDGLISAALESSPLTTCKESCNVVQGWHDVAWAVRGEGIASDAARAFFQRWNHHQIDLKKNQCVDIRLPRWGDQARRGLKGGGSSVFANPWMHMDPSTNEWRNSVTQKNIVGDPRLPNYPPGMEQTAATTVSVDKSVFFPEGSVKGTPGDVTLGSLPRGWEVRAAPSGTRDARGGYFYNKKLNKKTFYDPRLPAGLHPLYRDENSEATCRIVRSLGGWNGPEDTSYYSALEAAVKSAETMLYFEEQYMITDTANEYHKLLTGADPDPAYRVTNKLGTSIAAAVKRSLEKDSSNPLQVMMLLPYAPDMSEVYSFRRYSIAGLYALVCRHLREVFQTPDLLKDYLSPRKTAGVKLISRGLRSRLANENIEVPKACDGESVDECAEELGNALEKAEEGLCIKLPDLLVERVITAMSLLAGQCYHDWEFVVREAYVHSKLTIVDDAVGIAGSANINDRSLRPGQDSEAGVRVEGTPAFLFRSRSMAGYTQDYDSDIIATNIARAEDGKAAARALAVTLREKAHSNMQILKRALGTKMEPAMSGTQSERKYGHCVSDTTMKGSIVPFPYDLAFGDAEAVKRSPFDTFGGFATRYTNES